jgi:hypothetical protein
MLRGFEGERSSMEKILDEASVGWILLQSTTECSVVVCSKLRFPDEARTINLRTG